MSVEKKQTEVQHTFTAQNKFLRLTERSGSHPAVNLNDFGNDIRSVRVSEIGILISLLMSVEKHLNGELKEPFGDPDEIVLEPGQLMPTAAQLIDSGKWKKKEPSLEEKLRALDVVVDEPTKPVKDPTPQFDEQDRWLACEDIVRAWTIVGRSESYHEEQKAALRQKWPALFTAVQNFVRIRPHDAG